MGKQITIKLASDIGELIESGLDSFARASGYKDPVEGEESSSQLEIAEQRLKGFFREVVAAYNANKAADEAREAAKSQSEQALDLMTLTVEIEDVA